MEDTFLTGKRWSIVHKARSAIGDHESHQRASQSTGYSKLDRTASADGLYLKACTLLWLNFWPPTALLNIWLHVPHREHIRVVRSTFPSTNRTTWRFQLSTVVLPPRSEGCMLTYKTCAWEMQCTSQEGGTRVINSTRFSFFEFHKKCKNLVLICFKHCLSQKVSQLSMINTPF